MTHEQRNAAISRKIEAYTQKFATTKATARAALMREGVELSKGKSKAKRAAA